jgi:hypothetical protein
MAVVYNVTNAQRTDDVAVIRLTVDPDFPIGATVTLAGVGHGLDGDQVVIGFPQYLLVGVDDNGNYIYDENVRISNQILFIDNGADLARQANAGTVTYDPVCTWIDADDVAAWLGISVATEADEDFIELCAASSNAFCFRRRSEAGYTGDQLSVAPNDAVKLGAIQYAGALYRQRGSIDSFASFDSMSTGNVVGLSGIIKQLLGIDRPAVA